MRTLSFFLAAVCLASAQDLKVAEGLTDKQVVQRGQDETATLAFGGSAARRLNGRFVEARITAKQKVLPRFDWTPLNKIKEGKWNGELRGVPTGGPYNLELRVSGAQGADTDVKDLLVGDIWVLAGQSNMEGVGDLVDVPAGYDLVHSFDQADNWVIAQEPLHSLPDAADPVHWRRNAEGKPERLTGQPLEQWRASRKKGAGLGLPFALELMRRTGVPIGLLPCAHGGTSMDQWSPALKDKGGESLYGAMLRRVRAVGGKVRGVLWYQGESDANPQAAPQFQAKFEKFVKSVRDDFGDANLPFYYVQIGRHLDVKNGAEWNAVQEAQRKAEAAIPHSGMVTAVDLSLDDGIHVSTPDLARLGRRLTLLAGHDIFPTVAPYGQIKHGPRPVSAKMSGNVLRVTFNEVNGQLQSEGRVAGFSIRDGKGEYVPAIYKAKLDTKDGSTIDLYVQGKLPDGATLWYGAGKDPYCNIRDSQDMALPVFGPMAIEQGAAGATN